LDRMTRSAIMRWVHSVRLWRAPRHRSADRWATTHMFHCASIIRTAINCAVLLLLAGCFAPPKRHAWQMTREELTQVRDSDAWLQLSTNDYVRVPDSKRQDAVSLLQEHSSVPLDASQVSVFGPDLSGRTGQAHLVRGTSFSSHPNFTIVRFDTET